MGRPPADYVRAYVWCIAGADERCKHTHTQMASITQPRRCLIGRRNASVQIDISWNDIIYMCVCVFMHNMYIRFGAFTGGYTYYNATQRTKLFTNIVTRRDVIVTVCTHDSVTTTRVWYFSRDKTACCMPYLYHGRDAGCACVVWKHVPNVYRALT